MTAQITCPYCGGPEHTWWRPENATCTTAPSIPDGMVEVSKEQFFELLYADKRDIMPSHQARNFTTWEIGGSRERWGWATPGWANAGMAPKQYAVTSALTRKG